MDSDETGTLIQAKFIPHRQGDILLHHLRYPYRIATERDGNAITVSRITGPTDPMHALPSANAKIKQVIVASGSLVTVTRNQIDCVHAT